LRALRVLKRDATSPFLFVTERGAPFSVSGLQKLVERAGVEDGAAVQGAPPHAAARDRLRAGQQGRRYPHPAVLSGPPLDPVHGALHRTGTGPVQKHLALGAVR
jgi:hypothetical protein